MALSSGSHGGEFTSAFVGSAEMHGRTASAASEAYDPIRSFGGRKIPQRSKPLT